MTLAEFKEGLEKEQRRREDKRTKTRAAARRGYYNYKNQIFNRTVRQRKGN